VKQLPKLHYAGIDWATKTHAVCVVDQAGQIRAASRSPHRQRLYRAHQASGLPRGGRRGDRTLRWSAGGSHAGGRPARGDGHPAAGQELAQPVSASGAKSDPADAYLLADVLRTDGHRLAALTPDSEPTKILRALSRTRKDLVEARVALVNQLTSQLEGCFPGAIGLFHELHSPTAVAFLRRYPTGHAAAALTQASLAALLRRLHYSGRTSVSELLRRLQTAPAAGISPAEAAGRAVCVLALLDAIQVTSRQERELEAEIIERLEVHADQHIFTSLPRAGHGVRAAALLAELGDVRARFPTEEALAAQDGPRRSPSPRANAGWSSPARPATRSYGRRCSTSPTTPATPPLAAKIYAEAIQRTRHHPHAVRILARAWIRVIWRIWQDGVAYHPTKHRGAVRLLAA
jgi:transposase